MTIQSKFLRRSVLSTRALATKTIHRTRTLMLLKQETFSSASTNYTNERLAGFIKK